MSNSIALRNMAKDINFTEEEQVLFLDAAQEIDRLRNALEQCAGDYISPPCTMADAGAYLFEELKRRAELASASIHWQKPAR